MCQDTGFGTEDYHIIQKSIHRYGMCPSCRLHFSARDPKTLRGETNG